METVDLRFDRDRFKDYREKNLKLTQQEAAVKLGVKRQTLASWERGGHSPSIKQLAHIGKVYGVSGMFFLVGG